MINALFNELIKSFNNIVEDSYINIRLILANRSLLVLSFILLIIFVSLAYFVYTNYIKNIVNKVSKIPTNDTYFFTYIGVEMVIVQNNKTITVSNSANVGAITT